METKHVRFALLIVMLALLTGCVAEVGSELGLGSDGEEASSASGPPPGWATDPCKTKNPTVQPSGKNGHGQVVFEGTDGSDVIFGTSGSDFINGKGGNDYICGRDGADTIFGGAGRDYIDGGGGIDDIDAGGGNDIVHGRAGSDVIHGGPGNDYLSGDLLDDYIYGDEDDDLLLGGHGSDRMHGGPGKDHLRGDTGRDELVGGDGFDTVSFVTAMPPGQINGINGVEVRLTPYRNMKLKVFNDDVKHVGTASGDGFEEPVLGVERVIGSSFDDALSGPAGAKLYGGLGHDTCNGASCDDPGEPSPEDDLLVFVDPNGNDPGLTILGTTGADNVTTDVTKNGIRIQANRAITPGTLCKHIQANNPNLVGCQLPKGELYYLFGWGDSGADTFMIGNGLGRDLTTHISGGPDNDTLYGGNGEDILFSGLTGKDNLLGNGGDDALLSESSSADQLKSGADYGGGADHLNAGTGDDQLVSDYPCGNHEFIGGPGFDIAGFARSGDKQHIRAQLGGPSASKTEFWGKALNPKRCGADKTKWTKLEAGLEVLEGAELADELFGDDHNNIIWGRGGNDVIRGFGGNDWLDGHLGNDEIYGGEGKDYIHGGGGFDRIHAQDGTQDGELSCGAGGGVVVDQDPGEAGSGC